MPRALLFDLDRTLVDVQTFTDYAEAVDDVERLIGAWDDIGGPEADWDRPTIRCMEVLVKLSGCSRWADVSDLIEVHEMAAIEQSQVMPGVREAFSMVGEVPWAVVTLLPEGAARAALDRHGIAAKTLVPRRADLAPKPAADQPREACRLLGVDAREAVMIGDSMWDFEAALAAGCSFVGVTNGGSPIFAAGVQAAPTLDGAVAFALGD